MSAYLVDANHISYLVEAAMSRAISIGTFRWIWNIDRTAGNMLDGTLNKSDHKRGVEVGQMLLDENNKSVNFRYSEDKAGEVFTSAHLQRRHNIEPLQVIKACDAFEYQACEHKTWRESQACAFITSLRRAACRALPGYDDAKWGAPDPM